ncbi:MAG: rolling circle replication-associated protein, partial [Metamycoplasmataceae bacterium]
MEVYEYLEPIKEGYKNKIEKQEREKTTLVKLENYSRSIKRTKQTIRQLVNTNFCQDSSSFLTLTFKNNITDYDVAFNYWKLFKRKIERKYSLKLSYLGVVEFQERGAIHFHICLFNVPYLKHS